MFALRTIRGSSGTNALPRHYTGFWAVLSQAAFSYIGTEIVAIAAGEAKNPRKNLPKAIKLVYIRILLFYIGGVRVQLARAHAPLFKSCADLPPQPLFGALRSWLSVFSFLPT